MLLTRLGRLLCFHELIPVREPERIYMACWKCGHETPGWAIGNHKTTTPGASVHGASAVKVSVDSSAPKVTNVALLQHLNTA